MVKNAMVLTPAHEVVLTRNIHEASAAAADPGILMGVLGGEALRVPVMTPICAASLRTCMNDAR